MCFTTCSTHEDGVKSWADGIKFLAENVNMYTRTLNYIVGNYQDCKLQLPAKRSVET